MSRKWSFHAGSGWSSRTVSLGINHTWFTRPGHCRCLACLIDSRQLSELLSNRFTSWGERLIKNSGMFPFSFLVWHPPFSYPQRLFSDTVPPLFFLMGAHLMILCPDCSSLCGLRALLKLLEVLMVFFFFVFCGLLCLNMEKCGLELSSFAYFSQWALEIIRDIFLRG